MATTPPPRSSSRFQTPPPDSPSSLRVPSAPLYGAKYDQYEPYPPRFSARLASQRAARSMERTPEPVCPSSPSKMRSRGSPKKHSKHDGETGRSLKSTGKEALRQQSDLLLSISDPIPDSSEYPQHQSSSFSHRPPSSLSHPRSAATQALPTPAKTPSKRTIPGDFSSTSRTLFPSTGKMSARKPSPFSLDSFETSSSNEIQIFTDSRDRIPAPGPATGNPFASQADTLKTSSPVKPARKGKKAAGRTQSTGEGVSSQRTPITSPKRHESSSSEEDPLPNPEEGITMIFRGKKVFTKFADLEEQDDDEDDLGLFASRPDLLAANPDLLTRVKPLTRGSIKPRVLFPAATKDNHPLDEEVATDEEDAQVAEAVEKPVKIPAITPESPQVPQAPGAPGTTRLLRSNARMATQGEETPTGTNAADTKRKRISPFDQWLRKKQAIEEMSSPAPSAKREADLSGDPPLTPPSAKKSRNTRGGASTAPSA